MKFIVFATSLLATGALASVCHHDYYECCTGCKPIVADDEGRWGAQNGEWCLIDEEKCAGYHDPNYKECKGCDIVVTDLEGNWGAENGEWCYIDDAKCGKVVQQQTPEQPEQQEQPQPSEQSQQTTELPKLETTGTLPVIAINTTSGNSDAITQPVSKMVSDLYSLFIPNYVAPPVPYFDECTITVTDEKGKSLIEKAKGSVKVRGNFTTSYKKKPLRIKFDQKQSLLGMNKNGKYKNWVLLASYKDNSLVRDVAVLDMARQLYNDKYYVSDTRYVEVTVNGEYMGMYVLAELQQIAEGRVDINMVEKDYQKTDIGYLLEFDGYANNEEPLNRAYLDFHNQDPLIGLSEGDEVKELAPEGGLSQERLTIKSDIYSQEQHDFIANFVNGAYDIMYEAAYNNKSLEFNEDYSELVENDKLTAQQAVEKVVDVESLALYYIINEIACDADVAFSSFYMDVDFSDKGSKKLTFEAPWDFDSSLGLKHDRCVNGEGLFAANVVARADDQPGGQINAWLSVLIHQDWFQEIIRKKWNENYKKGVFNKTIDMVRRVTKENKKAFETNYKRWDDEDHTGSIAFEAEPIVAGFTSQEENAEFVAEWLKKRVEFINNYWNKN